jgi:hypothetical protein
MGWKPSAFAADDLDLPPAAGEDPVDRHLRQGPHGHPQRIRRHLDKVHGETYPDSFNQEDMRHEHDLMHDDAIDDAEEQRRETELIEAEHIENKHVTPVVGCPMCAGENIHPDIQRDDAAEKEVRPDAPAPTS